MGRFTRMARLARMFSLVRQTRLYSITSMNRKTRHHGMIRLGSRAMLYSHPRVSIMSRMDIHTTMRKQNMRNLGRAITMRRSTWRASVARTYRLTIGARM